MSNARKHFPVAVEAQGEANCYRIRSADGWLAIVQMNGELWTSEQVRLLQMMVAAPELLAALELIMLGVAGCERNAKYEAARAAIANAKGGAA